jgi:hypothetical protein
MLVKEFWHFGQILKDNHKLVTIFIKKNMRKMQFFFMKICLENFLGSCYIHENKIFVVLFKWKLV